MLTNNQINNRNRVKKTLKWATILAVLLGFTALAKGLYGFIFPGIS